MKKRPNCNTLRTMLFLFVMLSLILVRSAFAELYPGDPAFQGIMNAWQRRIDAQSALRQQELKTNEEGNRLREEEAQKEFESALKQLTPNPNPSALNESALTGDLVTLSKQLREGAATDEGDPLNGWSPLHYAAFGGSTKAAQFLLDNHANVNLGSGVGHYGPLTIAVISGHIDGVQLFLLNGANANARGYKGWTPLHFAVLAHNSDMVLTLLAYGALPSLATDDRQTPLGILHAEEVDKRPARHFDAKRNQFFQEPRDPVVLIIEDALQSFLPVTGKLDPNVLAKRKKIHDQFYKSLAQSASGTTNPDWETSTTQNGTAATSQPNNTVDMPPLRPSLSDPSTATSPNKHDVNVRTIIIPATAGSGSTEVGLGPLKQGQILVLQYVSGEWTAWHGDTAGSPDDLVPKNANVLRVTISEGNDGKTVRVTDIPGGTKDLPFFFRAEHDMAGVFLNMEDHKPKDNIGAVTYRVWNGHN